MTHATFADVALAFVQYGLPALGVVSAAIFGAHRAKRAKESGEFEEGEKRVHQIKTIDGSTAVISGASESMARMVESALGTIASMQEESKNTQDLVAQQQTRLAEEVRARGDMSMRIEQLEKTSGMFITHIRDLHNHMDDIYRGIEAKIYPPLPDRLPIPEDLVEYLRRAAQSPLN